jgi:hypothetical protein
MNKNQNWQFQKFEKLKGQFVIHGYNKVARFIGVGEDNHDYFFIMWDGRDVVLETPLCPVMQLKGKIEDKDYKHLVDLAKNNDYYFLLTKDNKQEEVIKAITDYITQDKENKILTELYLDIV